MPDKTIMIEMDSSKEIYLLVKIRARDTGLVSRNLMVPELISAEIKSAAITIIKRGNSKLN
ncbi:hypothetical protein KKC_00145 [Listeria fleischmannii subsp. coloradonensis]|nr:hypothetical protein KKC_00145 [Listeria fleischmannii subsp. coloradonensis]